MPATLLAFLALILTGVGASIFGSIVGLGGGFIAVPILRIFFNFAPGAAASTALVLVFANTASATISFTRAGRVAYDIALPVAIAAIPASIAGAVISSKMSATHFDVFLTVLLIIVAIDVVMRGGKPRDAQTTERTRKRHIAGWVLCGLLVGFVSSLFGIGGGIIAIPLLLYFTKRPLPIIAATSTAIIAMTAPVGIATHAVERDVMLVPALLLGAGGVAGGQIGAKIATGITPRTLSVLIAGAVLLAAAGMLLKHFL